MLEPWSFIVIGVGFIVGVCLDTKEQTCLAASTAAVDC